MIFTDSRYATGDIMYGNDSRTFTNQLMVTRVFPTKSQTFSTYVWTSEDRIDDIAYRLLGSPSFWWRIMDINPEVSNPFSIAPGTSIRIPNG